MSTAIIRKKEKKKNKIRNRNTIIAAISKTSPSLTPALWRVEAEGEESDAILSGFALANYHINMLPETLRWRIMTLLACLRQDIESMLGGGLAEVRLFHFNVFEVVKWKKPIQRISAVKC